MASNLLEPVPGQTISKKTPFDIEFNISDCSGNTNYEIKVYAIDDTQDPPVLTEVLDEDAKLVCKTKNDNSGPGYATLPIAAGNLPPGDYIIYIDDGSGPVIGGTFTILASDRPRNNKKK